jgi:hypothetical protein
MDNQELDNSTLLIRLPSQLLPKIFSHDPLLDFVTYSWVNLPQDTENNGSLPLRQLSHKVSPGISHR